MKVKEITQKSLFWHSHLMQLLKYNFILTVANKNSEMLCYSRSAGEQFNSNTVLPTTHSL